MEIYVLIALAVVLVGGIGAMLWVTLPIAIRVYKAQLVRTSKDVWGRVCSAPENEEQLQMWNEGCQWAEENKSAMEEVHIVNDGLNLYGEFYSFGGDKCVIILPGRCECLKYSYYFAEPYKKAGYNVLVIDSRAHGNSDGVRSTIGKKESGDVIAWANFIIEKYGIKKICFHCICVGSVTGLLASISKKCPAAVCEFVTEGCFTTFRETFKQHMIADKRPLFPVLDLVMILIFLHTGTNVLASSPIANIGKLKSRTLFLHSEKDIFSRPVQAERLFKKCGSEDKKLVWFDKGAHSHIRINNKEKYDNTIVEFLK